VTGGADHLRLRQAGERELTFAKKSVPICSRSRKNAANAGNGNVALKTERFDDRGSEDIAGNKGPRPECHRRTMAGGFFIISS
jgi:hypothetical protein